jgi:hypothetical protein
MKKIVFILACVLLCTMGCKQKTTSQDDQTQNNNEQEVASMKICQSCAMPLTEDLYGTTEDGTPNPDYCKYCYVGGQFTTPDLTMNRMIEICVPYMVQQGMPEENARILLNEILPRLKRWQVQE